MALDSAQQASKSVVATGASIWHHSTADYQPLLGPSYQLFCLCRFSVEVSLAVSLQCQQGFEQSCRSGMQGFLTSLCWRCRKTNSIWLITVRPRAPNLASGGSSRTNLRSSGVSEKQHVQSGRSVRVAASKSSRRRTHGHSSTGASSSGCVR